MLHMAVGKSAIADGGDRVFHAVQGHMTGYHDISLVRATVRSLKGYRGRAIGWVHVIVNAIHTVVIGPHRGWHHRSQCHKRYCDFHLE